MPKKKRPSLVEKTRWLKLHEKGKTESSIAFDNHRDIRTVKRGIEEARRGLDARLAKTELLKEALRKHHDSLLEQVENLLSSLTLSGPASSAPSWAGDGNSVTNKANTGQETRQKAKRVRLDKHFSSALDLLRQHLRGDKLWKMLAQREEALELHAIEVASLQDKIVGILKSRTGYPVVPPNVTAPPPFVYSSTSDLFAREALNRAIGGEHTPVEEETIADTMGRCVKYRNLVLAEAPGQEEEARKTLLDAFREIQELPEVRRAVDAYRKLEDANSRSRQPLEQLLLVGLVPGQCEVCRRLGL